MADSTIDAAASGISQPNKSSAPCQPANMESLITSFLDRRLSSTLQIPSRSPYYIIIIIILSTGETTIFFAEEGLIVS